MWGLLGSVLGIAIICLLWDIIRDFISFLGDKSQTPAEKREVFFNGLGAMIIILTGLSLVIYVIIDVLM